MSRAPLTSDRVRAVIDLDALRRNVKHLADVIAPSTVMLAVKADAYGHGLIPVSHAGLEAGATSLAVLEVSTGLTLREAGIRVPVLAWLHGTTTPWRAGIEARVELGISALWQLDAIASAQASRPALVHLKIDTGLSRNGATREDWPALVDRAIELQQRNVVQIRAAWSHLADTSVEEDSKALAEFHEAVAAAQARGARFDILHLAASSAGIRTPEARFDLVRFGIAAYGFSPFDDVVSSDLGLEPVMRLETRIAHIDTTTGHRRAVLAAGFADGIPVAGVRNAAIQIGGQRRRILTVDCDTTVVELEPTADHISIGEKAIVFGSGADGEATAEEYAQWAGTIPDEIVTGVPTRVPRVYRE